MVFAFAKDIITHLFKVLESTWNIVLSTHGSHVDFDVSSAPRGISAFIEWDQTIWEVIAQFGKYDMVVST